MKRFEDDIRTDGLVVGGSYDKDGNYYYAEVVPSGSCSGWQVWRQLLPSVGRWWYEVHCVQVKPMKFPNGVSMRIASHAYNKYGSGGAFTLRGCMWLAMAAVEQIAENGAEFDDGL